jgi:phosphorylcholine metabolism protein LicD
MKKELLLPYKRVAFEGHRLPVPGRDEEYLQRLYGDYTVLPPPEERHPKHTGYLRFTEALHR